MRTRILLTAVSFVMLAACNNLQEAEEAAGQFPVAASVWGTVNADNVPVSRVANDVWETGDAIGITGKSGNVEYVNKRYDFSKGSSFIPAGEIIYYIDKKTVEFSAYHPFNETGGAFEVNVSNQNESKNFDYLYATAEGSEAAPLLDFKFRHQMCKVVLNFLPGTGFAEDADFSNGIIRFASLHPTGTFNTITGSAEINAEEAGGLEFIAGTTIVPAGNTYSFILLPETVSGGVALSFIQEDGTVYEGASLTGKESADLAYEYNVTVNRERLTISSSAIHGWDETPGDKDVNINI
mgnify:FL=1